MNIIEIPIETINTDDCVRSGYGGIASIMMSINGLGLLHPIGITSDHRLVYGKRRLEACKRLKWKTIRAVVIPNDRYAFQTQRAENTCRVDLTPQEMVRLTERIEEAMASQPSLREEFFGKEEHEEEGTDLDRPDSQVCNNCYKSDSKDNVKKDKKQRNDTEAAKAAGFGSHMDYQRTRTVLEKGTQPLIDAMNRKQVSISAAAQLAKLPREQQEQLDYSDPKALKQTARTIREQGVETVTDEVTEEDTEAVRQIDAQLDRLSMNEIYRVRTLVKRKIDQKERERFTVIDGDRKD